MSDPGTPGRPGANEPAGEHGGSGAPLTLLYSGKVRDVYGWGDDRLLLVASDRVSAYDQVLPTPIPDKGKILTQLSLWWFGQLADLIPNQVEDAAAMLAKTGLSEAENWIFDDLFTARLRFEIDPRWQGEIPRTMLIARDGEITIIEGVADPAQIRTWLDQQKQ